MLNEHCIVWENVKSCSATAWPYNMGTITKHLKFPNSSDIIEERTEKCYSGDEDGEFYFKTENLTTKCYLVPPSNDSLTIFGSNTRVYEGDKIDLICQGGPSKPGIANGRKKTFFSLEI